MKIIIFYVVKPCDPFTRLYDVGHI